MKETKEKMAKNDGSEESDLDRMALEEIIKETKRGKERAETMGPMGWIKCPLVPTNKIFFRNVLMGTLTDHKRNNRMKERNHQRESLPKDGGRLTSDSPSSSHSSSRDGSIERKTSKDKYERSKQSYSSSKYSNEATSSVRKASEDKYKRSTRRDDVAEKRSHRSISKRHDGEKPRMERNQSRKHKLLEKHKKGHKHHKYTKKN